MNARAIAIAGLALACGPAVPQELPRGDLVFGVVMTKAIVDELRVQCVERYPRLREAIEEAYAAWPLAKTTVSIKVNGRDYASPEIARIVESVRAQFRSGAEAKNREECEGFKDRLENLVRRMPMEALAPFIETGSP